MEHRELTRAFSDQVYHPLLSFSDQVYDPKQEASIVLAKKTHFQEQGVLPVSLHCSRNGDLVTDQF